MDATFRLRRSYRNLALGGLVGYPVWGGIGIYVALTDPGVSHRLAAAALMGGIPLVMAGLSLYLLLSYLRAELTIRGDRVTSRGVVQRREIDLRDVTEACWRTWPTGGSLVLRSGRARLAIQFDSYEVDDRARIVRYLRSAIRPEIQAGWDLFVYRVAPREPSAVPGKPGPDEVLIRRDRWNVFFGPLLIASIPIGITLWWVSGQARQLTAPLVVLVLWGYVRYTTPAEGMVVRTLRARSNPDLAGFVAKL